ncbi:MAG: hypothetical protein ACK4JF_04420 [Methylohalobius sp.]
MRPERLYLTDIVEAADAIERFLRGISQVPWPDIVAFRNIAVHERCASSRQRRQS